MWAMFLCHSTSFLVFYEALKLGNVRILSAIWKSGIFKSLKEFWYSGEVWVRQWRGENVMEGSLLCNSEESVEEEMAIFLLHLQRHCLRCKLWNHDLLAQSSAKLSRGWCVLKVTGVGAIFQEYFETLLFTVFCVNSLWTKLIPRHALKRKTSEYLLFVLT